MFTTGCVKIMLSRGFLFFLWVAELQLSLLFLTLKKRTIRSKDYYNDIIDEEMYPLFCAPLINIFSFLTGVELRHFCIRNA